MTDTTTIPDTAPAIGARVQGLADRLAELRRRRGAAALAGTPDKALDRDIAALETELEAFDDARAETDRRARAAATSAWQTTADAHRAELRDIHTQRLKAIGRAETACRALAAALAETREHGDRMRAILAVLGARPVPITLSGHDSDARLSRHAMSVLVPALGGDFGELSFRSITTGFNAANDWAEVERKTMAADLDQITKENSK